MIHISSKMFKLTFSSLNLISKYFFKFDSNSQFLPHSESSYFLLNIRYAKTDIFVFMISFKNKFTRVLFSMLCLNVNIFWGQCSSLECLSRSLSIVCFYCDLYVSTERKRNKEWERYISMHPRAPWRVVSVSMPQGGLVFKPGWWE
jgi:hypothetical protein